MNKSLRNVLSNAQYISLKNTHAEEKKPRKRSKSRINHLPHKGPHVHKTGCLTSMCPFRIKRRGIPDGAMDAVECPGNQGACHEHFVVAGERCFDPQYRGSGEPEPGVIGRVPDHDHDPVPELPARPEPFFNKAGSNTPTLIFESYRKWCKGNSRRLIILRFDQLPGQKGCAR